MATGNTGEYLDPAADATCTWLSRDGGYSWEDVADHSVIYEFGDHGGILLTARYQVIVIFTVVVVVMITITVTR